MTYTLFYEWLTRQPFFIWFFQNKAVIIDMAIQGILGVVAVAAAIVVFWSIGSAAVAIVERFYSR